MLIPHRRVVQFLLAGLILAGAAATSQKVRGDEKDRPIISKTIDFLDYCFFRTDPSQGYFTEAQYDEAIRKVADGVPYLPAGIALKLFKGIREMKQPVPTRDVVNEPLTSRQEEVLALLGEGKTDREIGAILHLTEATVRSHVHRIIQRLGLENRAQAVVYANRNRETGDSHL